MDWLRANWSNVALIGCLVVVAVFQALQQALTSSPAVASHFPALNGSWNYLPLALIIIAGVLWWREKHKPPFTQQATSGLSTSFAMPVTNIIDVEKFFKDTHLSVMETEVQNNVRAMVEKRPFVERVDFCVRFISRGVIEAMHDQTWLTIYRSQILVLQELNQTVLRKEDIKARFYDPAVKRAPEGYRDYSFDQWFKYLVERVLVLERPGSVVEITVRGRDFLKYVVHHGYPANRKKM